MSILNLKDQLLAEFKCLGSGNCCRSEGYVYITEADAVRMAAALNIPLDQFKSDIVQTKQGWMLIASPNHRKNCFLDSCNRCQVYEARPLACRTYPHWPTIWETEESAESEIESCPGLKRAYEKVKLNN